MEQFVFGKIRVQLLSEDIIRIEYAKNGAFCDENTFFIPNRDSYREEIACKVEGNTISFGDYTLRIPENSRSLTGVRLEKNGKKVYGFKRLANTGELPLLDKTPQVHPIADTPRILVPKGGYSKNREGQYRVQENVQDIYLLLCDGDFKKLRKLYVELTGRPELVRLSTLGGWNSKYYAYTEETAKQLILDYEKNDIPLDNMVIDTDWRSCENGWGYDINTRLFPNMKRFLQFAHDHGVEIMFNDHPQPVEKSHVFRAKEIAYRERNLQAVMKQGLDTWWYDRNWHTSLISPTENLRHETLGLYLFTDITKHFYQKQAENEEIYRRPVVMGNAVNVENGNYVRILDTASHRYGIQWTGDIWCTPDDLAKEVATLIRGGNDEIVYINADCGGHRGTPDKEGFVRWMQFGTLSPVFRPHCSNNTEKNRDPWAYDEETLGIVREYNHLRYRLLPLLYRSAYEAYESGEPICRSLGWNYPDDKKAHRCDDAYMLGRNILIRPVAGHLYQVVEREHFTKPISASYFDGRKWQGEPLAKTQYDQLNMVLDRQAPEDGVPVDDFSARFETEVQFDNDVYLTLCYDDGAAVYIDGEKVLDDMHCHSPRTVKLAHLEGGRPHRVRIDYFQANCGACCILGYYNAAKENTCTVYLPKGRWLDPFDGKIYQGGKTICKVYGLRQMPLFIRLGALIPLAYNARNTAKQRWDKLVLDYYPDREVCDSDYLYEDDTQTTAYRCGQFRKTPYEARYLAEEKAYVVKLGAAEGSFEGDRCCDSRDLTVKMHLLSGIKIGKVTVNGEQSAFEQVDREKEQFPLGTENAAADAKTVCVRLSCKVSDGCEVKFYEA